MAVSIVGVAVLAVLLGRGVELNGDGVKVGAVGSTTNASVEDFEAQQPQLEATLDNRIEDLAFEPAAAISAPDINGSWFTIEGFRYDFFQIGSAVTFQEVSVDGLITGVGEGTITNNTLQFAYTNGFTNGSGQLTLDGDGDLIGAVADDFTGAGVGLVLFR